MADTLRAHAITELGAGLMKLIYTYTDEAPALATHSFLPIIEAFAGQAGVDIELRDISLAGRILAQFPDRLTDEQRVADALAELGELAKTPEANIIKLPNISASIPQLKSVIKELQEAGFDVPDYPDSPASDEERAAREAYDRVKGSAVNPVLREGNSDRRAPASVKSFAKAHPHSMGAWSKESKSHVSTMSDGDFRSTERSVTVRGRRHLRIEFVAPDGAPTVLKASIPVKAGEIVDGAVMQRAALDAFLAEQIADAKERDVLFSLHMKATMMKVSDPIIFGHAVRAFFAGVFTEYGDALAGANPNNGLASVLTAINDSPEREAIEAAITSTYETGPDLAMVDSDRGITNLHVPSDVIIDASMPAMIRTSGQMWNAAGAQQDAKAVIPDSCYAALYAETIDFCRENGAFDPTTMGTTPNVGLMAQKAEEYGSHDKTFEIAARGHRARRRLRRATCCSSTRSRRATSGAPARPRTRRSRDWVRLAVERARATGSPAVFWLDETRAHDAEVLRKVRAYLGDHDTDGLQIEVLPVARGDALHAGAREERRGHDLGHRQRAARLPDRPVPDPRARHQRQDALDRAADEGRRPVRDGRRRLGAEARPAAREGEPPALGLARRVPRAGGLVREARGQDRQPGRGDPGADARRGDGQAARERQVAVAARERARQPRVATSTSRCTGRRSWRTTRSSARRSRRSRSGSRPTRRRSWTS